MTTPAEQESLASSLLQRRWFWLAVVLLLVIFASLQYRLWFAEGSLPHTAALEERLAKQQMTNSALKERNDRLSVEVSALQHGSAQMEAHAREDLGLVKQDETFFMFVDEPAPPSSSPQ